VWFNGGLKFGGTTEFKFRSLIEKGG